MNKIILIIGARPNFMKAFPVYESLKNNFELILIHTGQHFDEKMSKIFFEELKFPLPDIHLNLEKKTKSGDFDEKLYLNNTDYLKNKDLVINELMNYNGNMGQLGEIRDKLKVEFVKHKPNLVIVFGDVTSTLAAGLAAKTLNIEIAHVESGLRSGDLTMPEEVNRILTDHITKYFFVTEPTGVSNLKREGNKENIYLVGNTMIDTQKKYLQQSLDTKYYQILGLNEKNYVIITLHRPSNVDNLDKLKEIFDDLEELSKKEKLVYPIHPRTKNNLEILGYFERINANMNIILVEPLGYLEFTCLMANCKYIVTDSGGLQEESTCLNIPCFTLRENTERPSTLIENNGTNQLINTISQIRLKECKCSMNLWNGETSNQILKILINHKININLGISQKELKLYIVNLKKKYSITNYNTNILEKIKNNFFIVHNKAFKIELPDIWSLNETANTRFEIHSLNLIILPLVSLFLFNEYNINIIKYCIEIINNWFDKNEKIDFIKCTINNNDEINWQDMTTSYRLGNILLILEIAIKFKIDIDMDKFNNEILYHIERLKQYLEYKNRKKKFNNHTIFISRYLIIAYNVYNTYFNKIDINLLHIGVDNFFKVFSINVDMTDYLSREHSTNYHMLYYRQLKSLLELFDEDNEFYEKYKIVCDEMYNNLNYFIYPNNKFVQIGDTDNILCNYKFNTIEHLKLFKNVGYAIYKKDNIYLSLTSSCHNRYHKHIDELSINFYNDCPILIEGGRYTYDKNNAHEVMRDSYFSTQKSKNSIVIDHNYFCLKKIIDELYRKEYTYGSGIKDCYIYNNDIILQADNPLLKLMQNIVHNRKVIYNEYNNFLIIHDNLISNDETEHISTRHFHFHLDWVFISIKENIVLFKHKILDKVLKFQDTSKGEIKYYYGQENPFIQGFVSFSENIKFPTPTLEITNNFVNNIFLESKIFIININYIQYISENEICNNI